MNPELALILIIALLWGPTAVWLAWRELLGPHGRTAGLVDDERVADGALRTATDTIATLVDSSDSWVCASCRSVNRRRSTRCYACGTSPGVVREPQPGGPPAAAVPVMAVAARPAGGPAAAVPVMATQGPGVGDACPFLGFKDDPATRFDFPDTRNLCHATMRRHAASAAPARPLAGVVRPRRPATVTVQYQASHCLTAAHGQCPRSPASTPAMAN